MSWPVVRLDDVAQINPRLPKNIDDSQTVSFIAMASAGEDGMLLNEEPRILAETKKGFTYFENGDVLLAKITPCFENGKCLRPGQISNQIGFGSTEFHVLRADEKLLDPVYLFYIIWSKQFRFLGEKSMSGAAGQKRVSTDFLKGFEIPLPPLAEQKRIATILNKADAIRRKRQKAIQLADEFLRAVFLDMFGDPVTNPMGWEVNLLGQLIKDGPSNGLYKPASEYGSGTRILRIDGFYSGVLAPQEKLKRVKLEPKEVAKYQLQDRSIVINRVNSREYLGKSAFIQELDEITVFESNMMNFSVVEDLVNPYFLVQQLQTPFIKNQILKLAKDAVNQSSINQQDVKSLEVLVPELSLQRKFEQVCRSCSASLAKYEHGLSEFGNMFGSLSQKAFKDEL